MRETPEQRGLRLAQQTSVERAFERQKLKDKGLLPTDQRRETMTEYDDDLTYDDDVQAYLEYQGLAETSERVSRGYRKLKMREYQNNPQLMAELERRNLTVEEYFVKAHDPKAQDFERHLWQQGTKAYHDYVLGSEETKEDKESRKARVPADKSSSYAKQIGQATEHRTGKDHDLESLLKVVLPDDDALLGYGVDSAPDPRKKKGRK